MKQTNKILAIVVILLFGISNSGCKGKGTSTSTTDDKNTLSFTASYPDKKTVIAQDYIENYLKDKRMFKSVDGVRISYIKLTDGTQFYLSYEMGAMHIRLKKNENSFSSYNRIKKMLAGFGPAIID